MFVSEKTENSSSPIVDSLAAVLVAALKVASQDPEAIKALRRVFAKDEPAHIEGKPLTRKEIAKHYNRALGWVDRMTAEGMPFRRIGGSKMFALADVDAWLDARAKAPKEDREDGVSVANEMARAGLRVVGGVSR